MKRMLVASFCAFVLAMVPATILAKSKKSEHGSGHGETGSPASGSSAYEHASDKASFQRDTHDMGQHQGQETSKGEDGDKSKEKSKATGKDKDSSVKGKDDSGAGETKGKEAKHKSEGKPQKQDKGLLEQSNQPKKEKIK